MANQISSNTSAPSKAYIITGPTSGYGLATAHQLARHGAVVLVGRDREKLSVLQSQIQQKGGTAVIVVCDLADPASIRRAAAEIAALNLPLAGLLNNAGVMQMKPTRNARGWDMTFATNHLGPFALTEALMPHLTERATVVFVVSAVEDPERKAARASGFRGGRFLSVEASARGEWKPGGAKNPGLDAYATSKQCELATALEFAGEGSRLHVNAIEPGFSSSTGLSRDAPAAVRVLAKVLLSVLGPFIQGTTTPQKAALVITNVLLNPAGKTGVYYDEKGEAMQASLLLRDPAFRARVVAETRAFLAKNAG